MPIVRLGNTAAVVNGQLLPGNRVTKMTILDEDDTATRMRTLTHEDGLWPNMSLQPPAWVESTDPELEAALSRHYGCPIGKPAEEDWLE